MGVIIRNMNMSEFSHVRISKGRSKNGLGNDVVLKTILASDGETEISYYGIVPSSEFFTGSELSSLVGLTSGNLQNSDSDWMKFKYKGKILMVPMNTFRNSISWDQIYSSGLVYGTNDNGLAPTGTPTNQYTIVTKEGYTYKVRLMTGSSTDPHNGTYGYDLAITYGSEWNELMYNVSDSNPNGISNNLETFSSSELDLPNANWTQEEYTSGSIRRVIRGASGIDYLVYRDSDRTDNTSTWRPVLELVE